jgi:hypothetical protein
MKIYFLFIFFKKVLTKRRIIKALFPVIAAVDALKNAA